MCTVHSILYTVHCTQYTVNRAHYTVHCILFTVYCTQYTIHCILCTAYSTVLPLHCTVYCNTHCAVKITLQCRRVIRINPAQPITTNMVWPRCTIRYRYIYWYGHAAISLSARLCVPSRPPRYRGLAPLRPLSGTATVIVLATLHYQVHRYSYRYRSGHLHYQIHRYSCRYSYGHCALSGTQLQVQV